MMNLYQLAVLLGSMAATFGVGVWFGYGFGCEATERRVRLSVDPPRTEWIGRDEPLLTRKEIANA